MHAKSQANNSNHKITIPGSAYNDLFAPSFHCNSLSSILHCKILVIRSNEKNSSIPAPRVNVSRMRDETFAHTQTDADTQYK
jgi:hypothetical protein